jgi:xylulokinase
VVVNNAECGVVGSAILAGIASGIFANLEEGVARCVEVGPEINPNPEWTETYEKMGALFDDLHETSQQFYDRLDKFPLTFA